MWGMSPVFLFRYYLPVSLHTPRSLALYMCCVTGVDHSYLNPQNKNSRQKGGGREKGEECQLYRMVTGGKERG